MIDKNTPATDEAMTIRAFLASGALQGILANPNWNKLMLSVAGVSEGDTPKTASRLAVIYADALIAELNKAGQQ